MGDSSVPGRKCVGSGRNPGLLVGRDVRSKQFHRCNRYTRHYQGKLQIGEDSSGTEKVSYSSDVDWEIPSEWTELADYL
jgi:hypothetical protein